MLNIETLVEQTPPTITTIDEHPVIGVDSALSISNALHQDFPVSIRSGNAIMRRHYRCTEDPVTLAADRYMAHDSSNIGGLDLARALSVPVLDRHAQQKGFVDFDDQFQNTYGDDQTYLFRIFDGGVIFAIEDDSNRTWVDVESTMQGDRLEAREYLDLFLETMKIDVYRFFPGVNPLPINSNPEIEQRISSKKQRASDALGRLLTSQGFEPAANPQPLFEVFELKNY